MNKNITGNKGDWSEIYAFLRLLAEGKIHAGDADMQKLSVYYPIINILRNELKQYVYTPDPERKLVFITESGVEISTIPISRFNDEADRLLNDIKNHHGTGGAFPLPDTEEFMKEIYCTKLKASTLDKADIEIRVHDLRTGMKPLLRFSIKSQLGSASSLLNASKVTNFKYLIKGGMNTEVMDEINSIKEHLDRMAMLYRMGFSLEYDDIPNKTFKNNLLFLDSSMPHFISECLIRASLNIGNSLPKIVDNIANDNPLKHTGNSQIYYSHKMKQLLIASALGMNPSKEWNGRFDANGGYIVVRKDGELICYHFYNQNDVEDYLFNNTCFERGSRSRHGFGEVYQDEDGRFYMNLNLQIRFKK